MTHSSPVDNASDAHPEDTSLASDAASPVGWFLSWSNPRFLAVVALILAAIAVAAGVAAWFDPLHSHARSYSARESADAKTHVCATYTLVRQGVVTNTHLVNPTPNDPAGQLAVAANARLALLGGGAYLRDRLAAEPAAPADIATTAAALATTAEELGATYLAGSEDTLASLRRDLDANITQLNKLCS